MYTDTATYSSTSTANDAAGLAVVFGLMVFWLVIVVGTYVIYSYFLSRIFKKAGVQQYIAWIPVYNLWKTLEIGGQQGYWAVLSLIPGVNLVSYIFLILAELNIGRKLQKEDWFVLVGIFAPVIWVIWLAVDKSKWNAKA